MLSNMRGYCPPGKSSACLAIIATALTAFPPKAAGATEKTLFAFNPLPNIGELQTGSHPDGTLLRDASGALYGAAMLSGKYYNGTIFKLAPPAPGQTKWNMSVLYTFTGGFDGGLPNPGLVMDASGALYGTTQSGGPWPNQGLVFKLTPPAPGGMKWKETVLHYFHHNYAEGIGDGSNPSGGLIMDSSGALYGTTDLGGSTAYYSGFGTVFKLTPLDAGRTKWEKTILYRFQSGIDGRNPMSRLTRDATGALYGTTLYGGEGGCADFLSDVIGCGTVFKLTPPAPGQTTWTKTTLHSFMGGTDGAIPQARLRFDPYGALYGTTFQGGTGTCTDTLLNVIGCGVVFKLTPPAPFHNKWTESVIHDFSGPDGAFPQGGLTADGSGGFIGTAGGGPMSWGVLGGYGVIYKLTPPSPGQSQWTETVLYDFDLSNSGDEPVGELIRDPQGHFFGVAFKGGAHLGGTVFKITP
jgi:hypothetical protein